jgi:signal transduction histidine kinase
MQTRLVEDLLDTASVGSGKLRLETQLVDLSSVLSGAVDMARPAARSKGIEFRVNLAPDLRRVKGDPTRLQQIVWNLLNNAIKFTPRGGSVELSLEAEREGALIVLRDTGRGIAPDFLPHIFERFRRAPAADSRRVGGLGLGLALARDLVMLHGGTIEAESQGEGRGATFTIRLPYAAAQVSNPVVNRAPSAEPLIAEKAIAGNSLPEARGLRINMTKNLQPAECG